jgi:multiple sugar transport system ATP-binding protein
VEAQVDLTELMGNEIFLFLKSGETEYVARVDPRTSYKMDDKVTMAFNMENMHVFDKETEQVIR